jgi:hypothetical protein
MNLYQRIVLVLGAVAILVVWLTCPHLIELPSGKLAARSMLSRHVGPAGFWATKSSSIRTRVAADMIRDQQDSSKIDTGAFLVRVTIVSLVTLCLVFATARKTPQQAT